MIYTVSWSADKSLNYSLPSPSHSHSQLPVGKKHYIIFCLYGCYMKSGIRTRRNIVKWWPITALSTSTLPVYNMSQHLVLNQNSRRQLIFKYLFLVKLGEYDIYLHTRHLYTTSLTIPSILNYGKSEKLFFSIPCN